MSIMAAKNFAIKLTEEALKIVRGEATEIRPLSDLAVTVRLERSEILFDFSSYFISYYYSQVY